MSDRWGNCIKESWIIFLAMNYFMSERIEIFWMCGTGDMLMTVEHSWGDTVINFYDRVQPLNVLVSCYSESVSILAGNDDGPPGLKLAMSRVGASNHWGPPAISTLTYRNILHLCHCWESSLNQHWRNHCLMTIEKMIKMSRSIFLTARHISEHL